MSADEGNDYLSPIDIPSGSSQPRRRTATRGNGNLATSISNLGNTLQSWAGNYSYTVSTYMSDNISVPASMIGEVLLPNEDLDQGGVQEVYHGQHLSPPISIPRGFYGSFLPPITGSPTLSEYGTSIPHSERHAPSISYSERRPRLSQATSFTSGHRFYDETLPLTRTLTKSSLTSIPISVVQDMHGMPMHIGSSFRQSIFNSCNILIGIGILALPLGFRLTGWVIGLSLFAFCLGVTNYTAKILAKCLDYDEDLRTYADMAAIAYGENARFFVSCLFSLELIASATALVILVGDSLHTIFDNVDLSFLKFLSWIVMTPLTLMAIRYLSYFSLMGILSAMTLVSVMLYDGLSKTQHPGSLIDPMETALFPPVWQTLPMSFGLIMAGFTGHAVFPSIYRDMNSPKEYPRMVNITYAITAVVYLGMACGGYLMFGNITMQEVTQNIMSTPGYNRLLNQFLIWMVAINPLAKYSLTLNPVNLTLEIHLNSIPAIEDWTHRGRGRRTILTYLIRIAVSTIVLFIAIQFPGFDRMIGILGSFFSFTISAIFPCCCYLRLFGHEISWKEKFLNYAIIVSCSCLATLGTIWAFFAKRSVCALIARKIRRGWKWRDRVMILYISMAVTDNQNQKQHLNIYSVECT